MDYIGKESTRLFNESVKKASLSKKWHVLGRVYQEIGNSIGLRCIMYQKLYPEIADKERSEAKKIMRKAIDCYVNANDEVSLAYGYYNFANQLRFLGEKDESLELAKMALTIAEKHRVASLVKVAQELVDDIGDLKN
jgi:tetratricopeptide (TPR) repeat protein